MRYSNRPRGARITAGILEFVCVIFLFLPFAGISFFAVSGNLGLSPWAAFTGAFSAFGAGGAGIALAILYMLLFLAALVLPVMTGIFILVNRKVFPLLPAALCCGALAAVWACAALFVKQVPLLGAGAAFALPLGFGIRLIPTLWLFLGAACALVPVLLTHPEPVPREIDTKTIDPGPDDQPTMRGRDAHRRALLLIRYSDDTGTHIVKRYTSPARPLTIGRSSSCGLTLVDPEVSSAHARVIYDSLNGMIIEDNDSTNGVRVNGDTIMKRRVIGDGDMIRLGNTSLRITFQQLVEEGAGEETNRVDAAPIRITMTILQEGYAPTDQALVLRDSAWIGREKDCDVQLHSEAVSRRHARLINAGLDRLLIEDNDSHNGVFVNDIRIKSATELVSGDEVRLADVTIRFRL